MSEVLTYIGTLEILTCGVCGIKHAIPNELYHKAKNDGKNWYCPSGHSLVFTKTELQKAKEQIEVCQRSLEWNERRIKNLHTDLTNEKHKVRAEKAAKTRIKNRVKNGVCPCCNRTFKALADHMKTKHPEYVNV